MRYLHAVAPHERFVAQGTYRYTGDSGLGGLVEHWTIHELPDGAWFMRVDKDGRDTNGGSQLIEAWRNADEVIERFDVVIYGGPGEAVKQARATYTVEDQQLHVGRTLDGESRTQETLDLPDAYVLQPGGYIFFGMILPQLVLQAPLAMVARFSITSPPQDTLRAALTYPPIAHDRDEAEVEVDGKTRMAQVYMAGERAADEADWHRYYVDKHGVLLRHTSASLQVQLERYAHR